MRIIPYSYEHYENNFSIIYQYYEHHFSYEHNGYHHFILIILVQYTQMNSRPSK